MKNVLIVFGALSLATGIFFAISYFFNERSNKIALNRYKILCRRYPNIDKKYHSIWNGILEDRNGKDYNLGHLSYSNRFDESDKSKARAIDKSDRLFLNRIDVSSNGVKLFSINDIIYLEKYYFIGILRPPHIIHSCFSETDNSYEKFLFNQ